MVEIRDGASSVGRLRLRAQPDVATVRAMRAAAALYKLGIGDPWQGKLGRVAL
jgi:hypothetical protein